MNLRTISHTPYRVGSYNVMWRSAWADFWQPGPFFMEPAHLLILLCLYFTPGPACGVGGLARFI